MTVAAGNRIGPYEIVSSLGEGGMGEVFRAWDYRLQREVAIKLVKASSADPEWQRRFLQEARAAGGLNHPNILTVHDVGLENGAPYLVTELIEGESLRTILKKGRLPLPKIIDFALQIVDGLSVAHSAGIVHRDLKPANIMVTKTGRIKLLDFGLAKQVNAAPGEQATELTEPGLIIGTATYMSPEQACGEPVDLRSDQFSFGLILYEMLAGTPAFDRGSAVRTMAAIMEEQCRPLDAINSEIPKPLLWIVERCLEKDRENRYDSTLDLRRDLSLIDRRTRDLAGPASARKKSRPGKAIVLSSLLVCLGGAGLCSRLLNVRHHSVDLRKYRLTPLATTGVYEGEPAWSPDGKNIAFTEDIGDVRQVFVRNLAAYTSAQITHSARDCRQPFWSPDGTRLFYIANDDSGGSDLWSVGASGGAAQIVRRNVRSASMAPNGALAYVANDSGEGLSLWTAADAQSSQGARYRESHWPYSSFSEGYVSFSADGKRICIWLTSGRGSSELWTIPYPAGQPHRALTSENGPYPFHWMPDGRRIVFGGVLPGTVGADLHTADLSTGEVLPITKTTREALQPAISPDSKRIAFTVSERDFDLQQLSVTDPVLQPLITSALNELSPAWSPVNSQLAFVTDRTGTEQIWVKSVDEGWERPLVSARDLGRSWVSSFGELSFSADGQRLAFTATHAGAHAIYLFNYAGGPLVQLLSQIEEGRSPSWSPDGNSLAFALNRNGQWWLATASSSGNTTPSLVRQLPAIHEVRWSPTGNFIACNARDTLFLISPDGHEMKPVSNAQWSTFDWQKDGSGLIGIIRHPDGSRVLASLDLATGKLQEHGAINLPSVAELGRMSLSRQTQRIALAVSKPRGHIWMLEGFSGPENLLDSTLYSLFPEREIN
ncbi:MAG TPA: protein kinase [Bryobacteraceae bacterium]|nr:protein kinase [Bryobacteraceae bacterium]